MLASELFPYQTVLVTANANLLLHTSKSFSEEHVLAVLEVFHCRVGPHLICRTVHPAAIFWPGAHVNRGPRATWPLHLLAACWQVDLYH